MGILGTLYSLEDPCMVTNMLTELVDFIHVALRIVDRLYVKTGCRGSERFFAFMIAKATTIL